MIAAFNINGEQVAPNSTTLNLYVIKGLLASAGSDSHKKRVASLSDWSR